MPWGDGTGSPYTRLGTWLIGLGIRLIQGRRFHVSQAFTGYPVALRPLEADSHYAMYFCQQHIATLDLTTTPKEP